MKKTKNSCPAVKVSLLLLATASVSVSTRVHLASEPQPEPFKLALLIGVGRYANLSPAEQLDGSANDVAAMKQLLLDRFHFAEQNVTTLVDEQATASAIRAELQQLARQVEAIPSGGPPVQVLLHFSGHGSQIPDQSTGPNRDEEDGLDETWVPYDATRQGGAQDIRDDEINAAAARICRDRHVRLLIVADCCHSGSGARGATKTRQLPRELTPTPPLPDNPVTRKQLPDGAVFSPACRAREVEPEFQDDDKTYGLLTRFLVETLSEEAIVSRLSYDLLQKAIVANYRRDRRVMQPPAPQLEGSAAQLQSTLLGFGPDVDRPPYYAVERRSSSSVLLRAGKFHQITVGSILELYDRPEDIAKSPDEAESSSQVWLRVTQVDGATSTAAVIRWEDAERTRATAHTLPAKFKQGFATVRHSAPSETGLRLKVVEVMSNNQDGQPLGPDDEQLPQGIVNTLSASATPRETDWLHWITAANEPCDLVLRLDGDYAALFPATGMAEFVKQTGTPRSDVPASLRGGWGPIDLRTGKDDSDPPQDLGQYLRRITQARNLISVAQSNADQAASGYHVTLELLDVEWNFHEERIVSSQPWQTDEEEMLVVKEGEVYGLRVTNLEQGGKPLFVTALTIGPDMAIVVEIPPDGPAIRLAAGESSDIFPFQCAAPHGQNYALLMATREPIDLRFVAQPRLPQTRGSAGTVADQLAEFTHFQRPRTRGRRMGRRRDTSWHAQVVSWKTLP